MGAGAPLCPLRLGLLANGPAVRSSLPVTGDVFVYGANTYTITSGTVSGVTHEGSSASGNLNGTFAGTPSDVAPRPSMSSELP